MGVVTGIAVGSLVAGVVGKGIEAKQQSNAYKRAEETLEKKRVKSEEAWAAWKEENAPVFAARRAAQNRLMQARGYDIPFGSGEFKGGALMVEREDVPVETMAGVIPASDLSGAMSPLAQTATPGTGGAVMAERDAALAQQRMEAPSEVMGYLRGVDRPMATQNVLLPGDVEPPVVDPAMVMGNPALSGRARY